MSSEPEATSTIPPTGIDLHGLFLQGQKLYQQLDESDFESSPPQYKDMVAKAQAALQVGVER